MAIPARIRVNDPRAGLRDEDHQHCDERTSQNPRRVLQSKTRRDRFAGAITAPKREPDYADQARFRQWVAMNNLAEARR
jgi:predicted TIM-barrel fold metal-dependent hydrolase